MGGLRRRLSMRIVAKTGGAERLSLSACVEKFPGAGRSNTIMPVWEVLAGILGVCLYTSLRRVPGL